MVGKIVLSKIYFTDISDFKIRPIYLFKKYDLEDYMFLPLSTNLDRKGILLKNDNLEFGNLKRDSVIVIPKIGIIHKSLILGEVGKLKENIIDNILKKLCIDLGCF